MGLISKVLSVLEDPKAGLFHAKRKCNKSYLLCKKRRFGALLSKVISVIFDCDLYNSYLNQLARLLRSPYVLTSTRDGEFLLDIRDPGISRALYLYGRWEARAAETFSDELSRTGRAVENSVVIDIGSNIGYYTLLEANALPDAELVAIEPIPQNMELLRKNLRLNGLTDRTSTHACAIAGDTGTATMQLSKHSNLHRMKTPDWKSRRDVDRSITVDSFCLDDFLDQHGILPADVVAVRMDVEGAEVAVLEGMERLLDASGPLLLYFEVHNHILSDEKRHRLVDLLHQNDLEIISTEYDNVADYPFSLDLDIRTYDEVLEFDGGFNLIVGRKGSSESPDGV